VHQQEPWLSVWAKTGRDPLEPAVVTQWLPLHQHLGDTSAVAGLIVDRWLSPQVVGYLCRAIGCDVDAVRRLVAWLAAVHDVGKASPAFAVQDSALADAMRSHGLAADRRYQDDPQRGRVRHEMVGQRAVRVWLADELGFAYDGAAAALGCVVGGHHGVPPTPSDINLVSQRSDLAGTGEWERARSAVLCWATDLVGGPTVLKEFGDVDLGRPAQVLLTAVVIMADWIASSELFELDPLHTAREPVRRPDPVLTAARAAAGWEELDLPPRWTPGPIGDVSAAFVDRFGKSPRPVQIAAVEAALAQDRPGMVIVEAPMGEGKTEAALLAVEALAARSGADGCFVALPTRATTDAMFGRVLAWMRTLPGLAADTSVLLAHGTASLNDEYRGLMRHSRVQDVGECGDEVGVAHQWLRGRKKGPLAQFVIGTVDQVLVAALKSRHLVLRHLALAGKVVVIDEVHAYDVYMSRYLDRVLHWLGAYGTPVVLLSATLPSRRRVELLEAYESGRSGTAIPIVETNAYPVVSATGLAPRAVPASGSPRPVILEQLAEDPDLGSLDSLVATLRAGLAGGGCAVVIRNTVRRVQATADRLVAEFGEEHVTVTHSRFLACDRARLDADLLRRFGSPGDGTDRPLLHVVVASQVVEQSLDVDFDLMITDLAPVDLVLQRMGRLHRHARPRPLGLERPRCVLTGVEDWAAEPVRAVAGSRMVYGEHSLLRAAALLSGRDEVTLPTDIAALVQAGYGETMPGPESWQETMHAAEAVERRTIEERRQKAEAFLVGEIGGTRNTLEGWVRAGVGDADGDTEDPRRTGQVRDGAESVEVLVVQRDRDGGLLTPDWLAKNAGLQVPLDQEVPGGLARTIASCALRLPIGMSQMNPVGDGVIRALERNHYTSFDRTPLLSGQLVLVFDGDRSADLCHGAAAFRVTYDVRRGLLHEQL
jgi:CRISPR-associated endonuclease/helicase Cas3